MTSLNNVKDAEIHHYVLTISVNNILLTSFQLQVYNSMFVWFDSLHAINNFSVKRDGSSWVEPVLS